MKALRPIKVTRLGFANGWKTTPPVVVSCVAARKAAPGSHIYTKVQIGRSLTEVSCMTCRYQYYVDSSD